MTTTLKAAPRSTDLAHDGHKRTLYVFVRTDLSLEQQVVQAAHAAAEAGRSFYRPEHGIASLIVLAVPNLAALYQARRRLESHGIEHDMFFEPDWNTGHSAIGTRPLVDAERALLRNYPLWKLKPTPHAQPALRAEAMQEVAA
jgi:hypothetical protein